MTGSGTRRDAPAEVRVAVFAVVVCLTHHLGLLTNPLGALGPTRTNDWLDLLTPYTVVGSALWVLLAAGASRVDWLLAALGAVAYVQGHGLHLAANSVANARPTGRAAETAHLWDEVVSHHVWYAGLTILVVALARALHDRPLRITLPGWLLALGVGITFATNGLEGGTAPASLAAALALLAWGACRSDPVGRLLLVTYGVGALVLIAYGLRYGGWPDPGPLGS